jgi:thiol-disulfide isomerase/thioredoxin
MFASKKFQILFFALLLAALAAGIAFFRPGSGGQAGENGTAGNSRLGQGAELPGDIVLRSADGGPERKLSEFQGKVLLINFWAGWCGPCIHEMPGLYELQKRYQGRNFTVLGLVMDDEPADGMKALRARLGTAPFPQFKGGESPLTERFAVEGLPYTVIVDKNRRIQYARPGEVDWNQPEVRAMIEKML